jgi:thiamine-phosphate pyrophosphorylase
MTQTGDWGFTPAAERTVQCCRRLAAGSASANVWAASLLRTLLQDESLAAACLRQFGVTEAWLQQGTTDAEELRALTMQPVVIGDAEGSRCERGETLTAAEDPVAWIRLLERARALARRYTAEGAISSGVLLLAVVDQNALLRSRLATLGATPESLCGFLFPEDQSDSAPLAIDEPLQIAGLMTQGTTVAPPDAVPANSSLAIDRILDACMNRGREGLRVLEDYARFVLNCEQSSRTLKEIRHELTEAEQLLFRGAPYRGIRTLLSARDTMQDVGTKITLDHEGTRESLRDLVTANCRRVQESLRSLEEFGKLVSPEFAAIVKQLRYRSYSVEQHLFLSTTSKTEPQSTCAARLERSRVYVLITEAMCQLPWQVVVEQALVGGADILQLREKTLNDRELLSRCRWLRDACEAHGALFIVNDRPELAILSGAHGTHVGQSEIPVTDVRRLPGPEQLIGVSTHAPQQLLQAFREGSDYVGVGPVFPSGTKTFHQFPGLDYVRQAAELATGPWFPIGGITLAAVPELCQAGARRVAVTAAVTRAADPRRAVEELQQSLRQHSPVVMPAM